jgi:hypothetical protein
LYVGTRAEIDAVLDDNLLEGYPPAEDADVVTEWRFVSTGECPDDTPRVIDWPTPQVNDVCGPDNATWVLPTGDSRISWIITDDGRLIGEIIEAGFTWPNGTLVNSWGVAPDSGEACTPVCEEQDVPVWHTWTGGPIPEGVTPSADDPNWNPNSGNPQSENHRFENHEPGVPYFVSHGGSGNGDWFLWTLEDCPEEPPTDTPVGVLFNVPTTDATCTEGETFDAVFPIVETGYTLTVDRPYDGPGTYTITATAADGYEFEGEGDPFVRSIEVTLDGTLVEGCGPTPTPTPTEPNPTPTPTEPTPTPTTPDDDGTPTPTPTDDPWAPTYPDDDDDLAATGSEGAALMGGLALGLLALGGIALGVRRRAND